MSGFKAGFKLGSGDSQPVSLPGMTCKTLPARLMGDSKKNTQKSKSKPNLKSKDKPKAKPKIKLNDKARSKSKYKPNHKHEAKLISKEKITKELSEYVLNRDDIILIDQMCDRHSISKSACTCCSFFGGYSLDQAKIYLDSTSRTKEEYNPLDTLFYNVRANKHLIKVIYANLTALLLAFDRDSSESSENEIRELFKKIMATVFLYKTYTNDRLNGKLRSQAQNIYDSGGNCYAHNRDRMHNELESLHDFWSGNKKYKSQYIDVQGEVKGLG